MKKAILGLALTITTVCSSVFAVAEEFVEGEHYKKVRKTIPYVPEAGAKGEIWEVFSYTCPHCFNFEPVVMNWLDTKPDDITFKPMPIIWGQKSQFVQAQAFYAAELLGADHKPHEKIYNEIHVNNKQFNSFEDYADVYEEYGIDRNTFIALVSNKHPSAFALAQKVNLAQLAAKEAPVTGTPSLIINGEYVTNGTMAGSNSNMFKVAEYLINLPK